MNTPTIKLPFPFETVTPDDAPRKHVVQAQYAPLVARITSPEELKAAFAATDLRENPIPFTLNGALVSTKWWTAREWLRLRYAYPQLTGQLAALAGTPYLYPYFIHPSMDDPDKVAYTASDADGCIDRQTVTTVGRLLRKLLPVVADEWIRDTEASIRAERSRAFFYTCDPEGVEYVYRHMVGDTGCMRYPADYWGITTHPSRVYARPGVGVAFLAVPDGDNPEGPARITARSVVAVDPSGAKRYVRVYGDPSLKAKLRAAGYAVGTLHGLRINALRHDASGDDEWYIVPYLDGPDGDQNDLRGVSGFVDGKDIVLTSLDIARGVSTRKAPYFKSTSPSHRVYPLPDTVRGVCALSGREWSLLDNAAVDAWMKADGSVVQVLKSALPSDATKVSVQVDTDGGRTVEAWTTAEIAMAAGALLAYFSSRWVHPSLVSGAAASQPDRYARLHENYVRVVALSDGRVVNVGTVALWRDVQVLHHCDSVMKLVDAGPDAGVGFCSPAATDIDIVAPRGVRSETLLLPGCALRVSPETVAQLIKTKRFVRCMPIGADKYLAWTKHPGLRSRSDTGRKVVLGTHDVYETVDGHVLGPRQTTALSFASCAFRVKSPVTPEAWDAVGAAWWLRTRELTAFDPAFDYRGLGVSWGLLAEGSVSDGEAGEIVVRAQVRTLLRNSLRSWFVSDPAGNKLRTRGKFEGRTVFIYSGHGDTPSLDELIELAERVTNRVPGDAPYTLVSYLGHRAVVWARLLLAAVESIDGIIDGAVAQVRDATETAAAAAQVANAAAEECTQ